MMVMTMFNGGSSGSVGSLYLQCYQLLLIIHTNRLPLSTVLYSTSVATRVSSLKCLDPRAFQVPRVRQTATLICTYWVLFFQAIEYGSLSVYQRAAESKKNR
jgi:hypothetical protein